MNTFVKYAGALAAVLTSNSLYAEIAEPKLLSGKWEQGAIIQLAVDPSSKIKWQSRDVLVTPNGIALIGLDRDAKKSLELTVELNGESKVFNYEVTSRDYKISRVEGIAKKIMEPNADDLKRIRAEVKLTKAARSKISDRENFTEQFKWPATGRISGVYGSQRFYNGKPGRPHYGVDVARPTGTPVYAPAGGMVVLAEKDMFYSGGTIIVDHGYGLNSSFLHLSAVEVKVGDEVKQGDLIGKIGATGRATGPHLDWRMNWRDQRVDPQPLVGEMPSQTNK